MTYFIYLVLNKVLKQNEQVSIFLCEYFAVDQIDQDILICFDGQLSVIQMIAYTNKSA